MHFNIAYHFDTICIRICFSSCLAGKTYTMHGSSSSPGILPRALQGLFDSIDSMKKQDSNSHFHVEIRCPLVSLLHDNLYLTLFRWTTFDTYPRNTSQKCFNDLVDIYITMLCMYSIYSMYMYVYFIESKYIQYINVCMYVSLIVFGF